MAFCAHPEDTLEETTVTVGALCSHVEVSVYVCKCMCVSVKVSKCKCV